MACIKKKNNRIYCNVHFSSFDSSAVIKKCASRGEVDGNDEFSAT